MKRISIVAAVFLLCAAMLAGCRRDEQTPSTLPSTTGATLMPTQESTLPSTTGATIMPTMESTMPSSTNGTMDPTGQTGTPDGTGIPEGTGSTGTTNGAENSRSRRGMNRGY